MGQARQFSSKSVAIQTSALPRVCSVLVHLLLISPCLLVNQAERSALASSPVTIGELKGDLYQIGGPSSVPTLYDVANGDLSASDHALSLLAAAESNTPPHPNMLSLRVADGQALECGDWRKSVKNGADADANQVDLSQPTPTTISTMNSWPAPPELPDNSRIAPIETTVWVVNATLIEYRRSTDQDYHLNLRDASGNPLIAEIPCPCCIGPSGHFTLLISAARSRFDSLLTATDTFQPANIPVRVAGVGMFDFPHAQAGAAPNHIELHPVLAIAFNVDLNAPSIVSAVINGNKLIVSGFNFDDGTMVLVDGESRKTRNDEESPRMRLMAKKAGKFIAVGQTVTIQVLKSDGALSDGFSFTKPNQ